MSQAEYDRVAAWFKPLPVSHLTQDSSSSTSTLLDQAVLNLAQSFARVDSPCFPAGLSGNTDFSDIESSGQALNEWFTQLTGLVMQAVRVHSPAFIGHMTSALPNYVPALMYLLGSMQQNVVKLETSGGFSMLEKYTLGLIHQQVFARTDTYYESILTASDKSLGSFCSGGTVGNLTALWSLRKRWQRKSVKAINSQTSIEKLRIYVSELGHYSIAKSLDILGLAASQLVVLPARAMQHAGPELNAQLTLDQAAGLIPWVIIGIAGCTETGEIDDLVGLAQLALKFECYFHVDAAWGGAFCFSEQQKHLLKGIELADTLVIDAHKQLYVPLGCGMVLFKDSTFAKHIAYQARYIIREGSFDLGQFTLEGSRPALSFILFCHFRILGKAGLGLLLNRVCQVAQAFAVVIQGQPDFQVTSSPALNIFTYRYNPVPKSKLLEQDSNCVVQNCLDQINVLLQKKQRAAGHSFVSRTRLSLTEAKKYSDVLRIVIANPRTRIEDCEVVLLEQRALIQTDDQIQAYLGQLQTALNMSAEPK